MGGASAQTAGPSGNNDPPDISQASSNDLNAEVGDLTLSGFISIC